MTSTGSTRSRSRGTSAGAVSGGSSHPWHADRVEHQMGRSRQNPMLLSLHATRTSRHIAA